MLHLLQSSGYNLCYACFVYMLVCTYMLTYVYMVMCVHACSVGCKFSLYKQCFFKKSNLLFAYYEMHLCNMPACCAVFPIRCFILCHHLKSYIYMLKNDLALLIILLLKICTSLSCDMPYCTRIVHRVLFWI